MRTIATICLGLALAGCTATTKDGTPIVLDGSLVGLIKETASPGSTYKARQAAADAKCRELGFKPGTEAYGNCRLQLEQIRATRQSADAQRRQRAVATQEVDGKVYDASECVGPVIMGRCEGSIIPNRAYHPTCHGTWLNGQCTGPMF
jgi:hypothetical protein